MARSPLEVVQSAYQAFGKGDLDAMMQDVAEAAEWTFVGSRGLPYTGSCKGKPAIARWFMSIPQVDEILEFEPREFLPAGEQVIVLGRERTRARPSGKVFEAEWIHLFTVREGLVTRFWGMYDTEASADARREEQADQRSLGGAEASP
jgi:ketosteroid isomerase-like protein